jgi:pimeloyl-ACP methyl ester carboxylesterase
MLSCGTRLSLAAVGLGLAACQAGGAGAPSVGDHTVPVFGRTIHYREAGAGPAVVLVHGLGGSADDWQSTLPALAATHHVYALDQIGFGQSDKPRIPYRVGTLVDFLAEFFAQVGIGKAAVVGNSLGGWTAAAFALAHPDLVNRLVLIDAAGFSPASVGQPPLDRATFGWMNPATLGDTRRVLLAIFADSTIVSDELVRQVFAEKLAVGNGYTVDAFLDSAARGDDLLDGRLGAIAVPTLVLWGSADHLIPTAAADSFASQIAGARKVLLDRCGHVPEIECADATNRELLAFLGGPPER